MNKLNLIEIGWLAGIIDGEGSFDNNRINVRMTDKDIIERLQTTTGVGVINPYIPRGYGRKPQWQWRTNSRIETMHILASIVPLLSERRRAKVMQIVSVVSKRASKNSAYCTRGHSYEIYGIIENKADGKTQRRCTLCRKGRQ